MAYDPGCIFCRIARGEVPSRILRSDDAVVAFEDATPVAPVHVLVIPRDHVPDVRAVTDPALLTRLFEVAHEIADEKGIDHRGYRMVFNVGAEGGQTVLHAHLHLIGGRQMSWPPG